MIHNWQWADQLDSEFKTIIRGIYPEYRYLRKAPPQRDMEEATDWLLRVTYSERRIGERLRRDNVQWRDWTIRAKYASGARTELEKLREGYCDFYLYGWVSDHQITEWMFINLYQVRRHGLLDAPRSLKWNKDGVNAFIYIPRDELRAHSGVVVAEN